ncbi:HD family phosphohydrolase [Mechercharimyces sp. CAU 1602]|uniref:HD family phosphohydrolase n=1 Tax=Mechercharimyces sp. CAU 1602 TaxID=2973933 RepID=UPI002162906C|nr:HDIG domain-containing metalloprotein [Mechercharimyces sp. CAU 1602]MCS1350472.1 HDIG domain-containing protein [Mechercharimyces sp. CAU 1602]
MNGREKQVNLKSKKLLLQAGWRNSRRLRFLLYSVFAMITFGLLVNHILPEQYDLEKGSVSKETITSPVTKVNQLETQLERDLAAESVEKQYRIDQEVTRAQVDRMQAFFTEMKTILADKNADQDKDKNDKKEEEKEKALKEIDPAMSEAFYQRVAKLEPSRISDIQVISLEILERMLKQGVRESELDSSRAQIDEMLVTSSLESDARSIVREITRNFLIASEVYDQERTEALRDAARNSVDPIMIRKGEVLVSAGDVITDYQYGLLKDLGLLREFSNPKLFIGLALLLAVLVLLIYLYLVRFQKEIGQDNSKLMMLLTILLLTFISMKVVALGQSLEYSTIGYIAPVALGTMLITLLLDIRLALWCGMLISLLASIFFNEGNFVLFDYRYGLVALLSSTAAAFALTGARNRTSVIKGGLVASLVSVIPILINYLFISGEGDGLLLLQSLGFGIVGGLFAAILTIGLLPILETAFDILSPLKLLELASPNHPLLRKLLVQTPGTYHHSLIVGNLAEAAAEAIGADGLLARVGAYYHDVGKTKRPQFFIENQMHIENPHDKLSPNLSKSIIIAHPRDGVEMLLQYRIPKPIRDIAAQHHGTTLVKYFYFKAKKQTDGAQVLEADYRYPGPKAQFKEAAIVGVADCVEAAVRSLARPTPSKIEGMVRSIIQDRLQDGQFDECDLTLKELDLIARSICETLNGVFHSRIEYPAS